MFWTSVAAILDKDKMQAARAGVAEVSIEPAKSEDLVFMVRSDAAGFAGGRRTVELRVIDGDRYDERIPVTVIGPFGSLGGGSR